MGRKPRPWTRPFPQSDDDPETDPPSIFEMVCPFDDPATWDAHGEWIDPDDLVTDDL